jgi:hypothetical protein
MSLTLTLGKIFERFVADWVIESFTDQIDKRQFNWSVTSNDLRPFMHC